MLLVKLFTNIINLFYNASIFAGTLYLNLNFSFCNSLSVPHFFCSVKNNMEMSQKYK